MLAKAFILLIDYYIVHIGLVLRLTLILAASG